jgi:monoamine oxidase
MIVAIPPALAGRIEYEPQLPAARGQLARRMPMSSVIKCVTFYDAPLWRTAGYSGEALGDSGAVKPVFDDSPEDGAHGALVGFIMGKEARAYTGKPEARQKAAIESFVRFFGPSAASPVDYIDQNWPALEEGEWAADEVLAALGQNPPREPACAISPSSERVAALPFSAQPGF